MKMNYRFPSTKTDVLEGPAQTQSPPPIYHPVNCEFTDELEYLCINKIEVVIRFLDEHLTSKETSARIIDIYTRNKEEFVALSNKMIIRLDHLERLTIANGVDEACRDGVCLIPTKKA